MNAQTLDVRRAVRPPPSATIGGGATAANESDIAPDVRPIGAVEPIVVREMGDGDRARWDAFVEAAPDATFFHRVRLARRRRGRVRSAHDVPVRRARRSRRRRAAARTPEERAVRRRADLAAVLRLRRRRGDRRATRPPRCSTRPRPAPRDSASATSNAATATSAGARRGRRPTCTSRSARRSRRTTTRTCSRSRASSARWSARASRPASSARVDDDLDRFFALYADNVHRHGTPAQSRRYFETLKRTFGDDCSVLTVSSPDGRAAVERAVVPLSRRGAAVLRRRRASRRARPPRTTSSTGS